MVMSHPAANTMAAACGSVRMLNSATGVTLPRPAEPPIITSSATFSTMSGAMAKATAMLVSGPSVASVTGSGASRSVWIRKSTAWPSASLPTGSGRPAPSIPVRPWTCSAVSSGSSRGRGQPAWTGIRCTASSVARSRIRLALASVNRKGTLPATVVMPLMSNRSRAENATINAMASSWPGSQSMISGRLAMPAPFAAPLMMKRCGHWAGRQAPSSSRHGETIRFTRKHMAFACLSVRQSRRFATGGKSVGIRCRPFPPCNQTRFHLNRV